MVERINLDGIFPKKRWKGPVARRDPDAVRDRSVIDFWRCPNPVCGQFTPEGSRAAEKCLLCHTPMPDHARQGLPFPD